MLVGEAACWHEGVFAEDPYILNRFQQLTTGVRCRQSWQAMLDLQLVLVRVWVESLHPRTRKAGNVYLVCRTGP